jgi:PAS domain S-box-containing protein
MTPKKREPSILDLQSDNQRLLNELEERDAELAVIKDVQEGMASGLDIDSIFELAGERIAEIFPGKGIALFTYDPSNNWGEAKYILEKGVRHYPPPFESGPIGKRAAETKQPLMLSTRADFKAIGALTIEGTEPSLSGIYTPLLVHDKSVGALNIESAEKEHAFTESNLRMVSNIASSLSVALENARLFDEVQHSNRELTETLQQQTAMSDILHVTASSRTDVQPVLVAVAENAARLFDAIDVQIYRVDEDSLRQVAHFGPSPSLEDGETLPLVPGLITGRAVLERKTVHIEDLTKISESEYPESVKYQERFRPTRTAIATPLVQEGDAIGAIVVRRNEVRPFTTRQIELLTTFAHQAAIAIENVRLFNETEQRAQELAIINSVQSALAAKLDIQAIYDAVGDKIHEIFFETQVVDILTYDPATNLLHPRYVIEKGKRFDVEPWPLRGFRKHIIETGQSLIINENVEEKAVEYDNPSVIVGESTKSWAGVPMIVGNEVKGVISLQHIDKENAFSDSDVRLLETLAISMSVALENARLFDEVQKSNREITEALEQQTATSDILQVMASSPTEIQPVLDAVAENAARLFDAIDVQIYRVDGDLLRQAAHFGSSPALKDGDTLPLVPGLITGRAVIERRVIHFHDLTEISVSEYPESMKFQKHFRPNQSVIVSPLVREDIAIGAVVVWRDEGRPFTEKLIALLSTFANQAAIAVENVRLFNETEQRAAELQIINSVQEGLASKLEMQAIYDLVGNKIREIFNADTTFIAFHDVENHRIVAPYYTDKGERGLQVGRPYGKGLAEVIIESGERLLLSTSDEMNDAGAFNIASPGSDKDLNQSFLGVPIFRNGKTVGATSVQSYQPYAFDDNDLSLLQTLTNSMSVALENARLFDRTQHLLKETEERAAELATINTVGQALVTEPDLDALIQLIGEQIRQAFSADIVYVALTDEGTDVIQFPYTYGEEFNPLQLGEGLTGKIIETGEPLLINREMDKRRAEMGITQVGVGARSYLGVPIQMGGQTFGVISAQSTGEEGRFDQDDLHLLNTIAANVGTAIRNAQLFDEIKRQNQYNEAVIENSPAAIVILDMEANVTGWNPAAEKLFGYTEAEALGKNVDDLVAKKDDIHAEAERFSQKALSEKHIHLLARRTRKDGSLVDVEVSGVPIAVDGVQADFIAIYHDVTELQRAREAAEQANQAKSTFLANMSHELRTPLNAIIGFTRIVRRKGEDVLPGKQIQNLDKVLISADHLLNLINSVLDISKIEAGRMDVNPEIFELPKLINFVVGTSQPLLQEGVDLEIDVQPDLLPLTSDQDMIKQILINLLSNAAKFTKRGKIVLTARQDGSTQYVDVSDTGVGISEGDLERIFEEFRQADASTTREYGGTGLGLSISRNLARLLGGDLTASSVEGEGSTFTLSTPVHYDDPGEGSEIMNAQGTQAQTGQPLVLSIDDDPNVH